jgi:type I restriction enzyme R subunit
MTTPEQRARLRIDALLAGAGWSVQDVKQTDLHAARGVAIREFELNAGFGTADYLLYVDGRAAGVIEAKKKGTTLVGVETRSAKYAQGLPARLPAWRRPSQLMPSATSAAWDWMTPSRWTFS